jgi:nucleotide-binding universal stress UspA family protein
MPRRVESAFMYEVLVPIDQSESRAIAQVEAVASLPASSTDVKATLLHVFTDNPEGASVGQLASVRRAREHLDDAGVEFSLAEGSGTPQTEIVDQAADRDVDAICVAGRKRSPTGKAVFGSVSQSVIIDTDRTVLFAHVPEDV